MSLSGGVDIRSEPHPLKGLEQLLFLIAVCTGCALSHMGTSTMPFQIGALVDGSHRSAGEAGLFAFLEIGAVSAGMMLISPWVGRFSARIIAMVGCALTAVANVGLYGSGSFPVELTLAIGAGLGYGFIFAATVSAAAVAPDPDRAYAIGCGGGLLIVVGLMMVLAMLGARWGPLGLFAALAIMSLLSVLCFFGFEAGKNLAEPTLTAWRIPGCLGLLFSWTAASIGTSAVYAFSERVGHAIQLPPSQIATVLSLGVFIGLLGTVIAAVLGKRVNRTAALLMGMLGSGGACLLLACATTLSMYVAGVFLYWIFYMFLYAYFLGTAALLDPAGRVGTLAGGLERMGYAVGAGVGGYLTDHASYASIGFLAIGSCVLGAAVGFPSLFREVTRRKLLITGLKVSFADF